MNQYSENSYPLKNINFFTKNFILSVWQNSKHCVKNVRIGSFSGPCSIQYFMREKSDQKNSKHRQGYI